MADIITVSPHAEGAKALIEKIRALRAEIPRFVTEVPVSERRRLVTPAAVPQEAIECASVALERSQRLAVGADADAARLRDAYSYALAYEPVAVELQSFAVAVLHTIRVQRAAAGSSALDVFAHARRMARRKDGGELLPFIADMRKKLRTRGRARRAVTPAPDAPVPATPGTDIVRRG